MSVPVIVTEESGSFSSEFSFEFDTHAIKEFYLLTSHSNLIDLTIAKGQNARLRLRVREQVGITVDALVLDAATSIRVKPLTAFWNIDDKIVFGYSRILTLTANAVPGDEVITVAPVNGSFLIGAIGRKIRDISEEDYRLEVAEFSTIASNDAIIAKDAEIIDDAFDPAISKSKLAEFVLTPSDTASVLLGTKPFSIWRRDSGALTPVLQGDLRIVDRQFLPVV